MPPDGRFAAVLGSPVRHSLSPVLHRAAYAALGLTGWTYAAIECTEPRLPGLLAELLAENPAVAGFSATMPLKRAALATAATAGPVATAIGAANTLLPGPTGWHAENTDWLGLRDVLAERDVRPRRVVLLGAGGTAQAALAALPPDSEITVLVRSVERAGPLLATAERLDVPIRLAGLDEPGQPADLLLSTLPAGAADPAGHRFGPDCTVLDVVYAGWPTALARAAAAAGSPVISGAGMLLHQAAGQVALMTGRAAPVEAMRAAMRAAVPGCDC